MSQAEAISTEGKCPYHTGMAANDSLIDERKTAFLADTSEARAKKLTAKGGIKIESFGLTRKILRSGGMQQAGFMAELVLAATAKKGSTPVLFKEGEDHLKQRTNTARFFAPRIVTTR